MMGVIDKRTETRPALRGLGFEAMASLVQEGGFPLFRAKQLYHWVFRRGARSLDEMHNLPRDFRHWLEEHSRLGGIREVLRVVPSADDSIKFLFELHDGLKVESVLMPGSGSRSNLMTLCVSSQVGCAVDCRFCVTGLNGFFRQMTADEIVDQVLSARRYVEELEDERSLRNIVFMGMGEPLLNCGEVIPAIRLMLDRDGMDLGARRITVSTSGIIPGIEELGRQELGVGLAVSLNSPYDEERRLIMPITGKYPLQALMDACGRYPRKTRARITFEYVVIKGFNDTVQHADDLARLVKPVPCKVNVIPFNPDPGLPFERPEDRVVEEFAEAIRRHYLTCSVRWSKALDVSGACGQLAGQHRQRRPAGGSRSAEVLSDQVP